MKTKPTGVSEALLSLPLKIPESTEPPLPPLLAGGTGNPVYTLPPGISAKSADPVSVAAIKERFRNRAKSVKRKADTAAAEVAAKAIRLSAASKPLVSMINDNKKVVENIMKEVSSEHFMDTVEPTVLDLLTKIALGLEGNSKIVEHYVSELEGIKSVVNDVVSLLQSPPIDQPCAFSWNDSDSTQSGTLTNNSRSHLPQSPLDGPPTWNQVVSRKKSSKR